MNNNKNKFILPVICILLFLAGCFVYQQKRKIDDAKKLERIEVAEQYNKVLKELRNEKNELTKSIEELKNETVLNDKGSTIILLADTNKEVVEAVEKKLDDYKYVGVISIDDYYDPDLNMEGYLNHEDIVRLVNKGYELVLTLTSSSDVISLYNKYTEKGYEIKGFYFPNSDITESQKLNIKSLGIENIITYLSTVNSDNFVPIMSIGSYDTDSQEIYEKTVSESLISALSIGILRDSDRYVEKNITNMLKLINEYEINNKTKVVNISNANSRYKEYLEELKNSNQSENLEKIEELESKLAEIEAKLAEK